MGRLMHAGFYRGPDRLSERELYSSGVQLILEHLPHLIPAAAGLGFLGWFWWHMRSGPPPDLDDQELAAWQEARSARRRRAKLER
jgi:nitrogen fixation-related uncharacterized protein